jgi:hypothetical protein
VFHREEAILETFGEGGDAGMVVLEEIGQLGLAGGIGAGGEIEAVQYPCTIVTASPTQCIALLHAAKLRLV